MDDVEAGRRAAASRAPSTLDPEILDLLGDAVLITDPEGAIIEANLAAAEMLGYPRAELLSRSVGDLTTWPLERIEAELARLVADGYWRGQVELRRKDGSTLMADSRAGMVETPEGRWGLAILREPDPQLAALQTAERRLSALVRSSDDAIYSVTPDGLIDAWNPAAERLYGYRAEEVVGSHVTMIAPRERHAEVRRNIQRVMSGVPVQGLETVQLTKEGRRIDVAFTMSPIVDADDVVVGMSAIGRDISERIRAERWTGTLSDLSQALEDAATHDELFEAALDSLQRTLLVAQAGFLLTDEDGVGRFRAWRGLPTDLRDVLERLGVSSGTDGGPLAVPDVQLDERLAQDRATIERAGCRSFLVVPIVHQGAPVGAVIVCFDRPRELPPDELQFSLALGAQVSVAIARLRAERALQEARATLELLTASAGDGITIQDTNGSLLYANRSAAELTGYDSVDAFLAADPRERVAHWEMFDEDGRPIPLERLPGRRVLSGEREAESLMHVRDRRSGRSFWALVKSTAAYDGQGQVRYAINIFHDVTRQKEAELTSQLRATRMAQLYSITATLSSTTDAAVVTDALVDFAATALGADRTGVVVRSDDGETLSTVASRGFDDEVLGRWRSFTLDRRTPVGQAVLANEPVVMTDRDAWIGRYPDLEREALPASAVALPLDLGGRAIGGLTLSFDRQRSFSDEDVGFMLAAARQGAQALDRARVDAGRRLVQARLSILARAGDLLAQSLDYPRTLAAVADLVVPRLADWASVEILEPGGEIRSLAIAHVDPDRVAIVREFRRRRPPSLTSPSGSGRVIATGAPELIAEITEEMILAVEEPEVRQLLRDLELRSAMTVPLRARGRTLGAMSFVWAESGNTYSTGDLEFAQTLAARMALVIDNARLYRDRDHIARTLQQSLLPPDLPEIDGVDLAARYRPSGEGVDVGGDFYDAFEIGDGEWTVALGDVCGKGPDAAALMGMVRHTIRAAAIRERAPSRVLGTVNAAVRRQTDDAQFCTAVAVRLRPQADRVTAWVAVAGHPPPLLVRSDGSTSWVGPTGALLGVFEDAEVSDAELTLARGDVLVLYTDGVTEVRDAEGELGEGGLAAAVEGAAGRTAFEIADAIEGAVRAKAPDEPRDDIAILVVRVTG
ncbi:MAG TPA: PAS domain S-box protein [Actinomycetota bacterium]|nr:PAS domain S-box protein [Actinomycetota bacterium]